MKIAHMKSICTQAERAERDVRKRRATCGDGLRLRVCVVAGYIMRAKPVSLAECEWNAGDPANVDAFKVVMNCCSAAYRRVLGPVSGREGARLVNGRRWME